MTLGLIRAEFLLRDVTLADAPTLFAWRCAPRIAEMMLQPRPTSFEAHLGYLRGVLASSDTHALYVLEHRGRPVGHVGLKLSPEDAGTGDWTIYLGEMDAPRGSGFALGVLALDRIFERPGFALLRTRILRRNALSQRLHVRLGFTREAEAEASAAEPVGIWSLTAAAWKPHRITAFHAAFRAAQPG
ncbi:GNAT family N-acetyltransferase [Sediminicoccus rosea]|uniref:GNAT family N-acetyltransferase n=1 Tax=Sediminicoccus rosea TaxID=1225128 RepID=A0ABZ0PQK3_9PROT|nr:GNAT family N-acetyltransferase [Sediminicoccus rosea]WPB87456.1 GNAT family N-acetyltransferase [Sediminicoccus rosea]